MRNGEHYDETLWLVGRTSSNSPASEVIMANDLVQEQGKKKRTACGGFKSVKEVVMKR